MIESQNNVRVTISEEIMLARLAQSEQMREFFIAMWKQNPSLAKQGGAKVQNLLTELQRVDTLEKSRFLSVEEGVKQRGISLIELIMFIVIVSVALAGVLLVMNQVTKSSADPLIRKQALAIAESLLEEIELMPFTYCDPDDANAGTATGAFVGAGGCATTVEAMGPEAGETRYSTTTPFDNVNDYQGFAMSGPGGIMDIAGTPISPALDGYSATVAVVQQSVGGIAAAESLLITVSVTGPGGSLATVEGMRTRYAPRMTP